MGDVTLELEVIQAVGRALSRLPDPDAQQRVIRWINDRFQSAGAVSPDRSDRPGSGGVANDPNLVVDELAEFFEVPGAPKRPTTLHRDAEADMLKVEADMLDVEVEAPAREVAKEPEAGIDSLVRGFVSDFQRIALEWQGA